MLEFMFEGFFTNEVNDAKQNPMLHEILKVTCALRPIHAIRSWKHIILAV
jgi:hypothetical protein